MDCVYRPAIIPANNRPNSGGTLIRLDCFAKKTAKLATKNKLSKNCNENCQAGVEIYFRLTI